MTTHNNSMISSRRVEKFNRRLMILSAYDRSDGPVTDRQVALMLDFSDMNAVRPRITELIREGFLKEVGTAQDHVTGQKVRLTARNTKYRQLKLDF